MSNTYMKYMTKSVNEILNLDYMVHLVGKEEKEKQGRLQLYGNEDYFLAVGGDADQLYMLFGWDLCMSERSDENCTDSRADAIPYIVVNSDGITYLKKRGIAFDVISIAWVYDKQDPSVAFVQQSLDLLRATLGKDGLFTLPLIKQTVELEMPSYNRIARMTSITVKPNAICVVLDGTDRICLLENNVWNLKPGYNSLFLTIGEIVARHHHLLSGLTVNSGSIVENIRENNTKAYNIYSSAKVGKQDALVLVKEKGFFISFDDDAIKGSQETEEQLYNCMCVGRERHTAAVVTPDQFRDLTEKDITMYIVQGTGRTLYDYLLSESLINRDHDRRFDFSKASVYKKSTGDYVIRATFMGKELPEVILPIDEAHYYISLKNNTLEKRMYLSALCHIAYDRFLKNREQVM